MFALNPLTWARVALCLALLVPATAQTHGDGNRTSGRTEVRLLESASGDLFVVTIGVAAGEEPPTFLPPDLATVCLVNPPTASATKAFGVSEVPPPRTPVPPGQTACASFEAAVYTIRLWTLDRADDWRPVLTFQLDLRDRKGTTVTIDWSLEGITDRHFD